MNADIINDSTILIVDDNQTNLGVLFDYLSGLGFTVIPVKSGKRAIKLMQRQPCDIVLLDIMMPDMDGYETCRRLKTHPTTKDIPVIFMSALSETVDKVKGFKTGAVDYITKPYEYEEVLARIEIHLTLQHMQRQLNEKNQALHHARMQAESLQEVAMYLNRSLEQNTVLEKMLEQLGRIMQYDSVGVFLKKGNSLVLSTGIGVDANHIGSRIDVLGNNPTVAQVFKKKQSLVIANIYTELDWELLSNGRRIHSWVGSPFLVDEEVIGVLSVENVQVGVYNDTDAHILQAYANQAAVAIHNARLFQQIQAANEKMQKELALAQEVQHSLLPSDHTNWSDIDITCYMKAAREIGGDFYDYRAFQIDNGSTTLTKYGIALGDISGKGVSAALLMAMCLAQLDNYLSSDISPKQLLETLDTVIMPYFKPLNQNCAMVYVEIIIPDSASTFPLHRGGAKGGIAKMVNAGCVMPLIKRLNGSVEWVQIGGMPLGIGLGSETGYMEATIELQQGDMSILTSDGVVEAMNEHNEMFGFERLEHVVELFSPDRRGSENPCGLMLEHVKNVVMAYIGNVELHDDLTIVVVGM